MLAARCRASLSSSWALAIARSLRAMSRSSSEARPSSASCLRRSSMASANVTRDCESATSARTWSAAACNAVSSRRASSCPTSTLSPTSTGRLITVPEIREPTLTSAPTTGRITPVATTVSCRLVVLTTPVRYFVSVGVSLSPDQA